MFLRLTQSIKYKVINKYIHGPRERGQEMPPPPEK